MTVLGTDSRVEFACNGATVFPLGSGFLFFNSVDLVVVRIDAAGVETVLAENTGYTVTGGNGLTGSVTTVATYSDGRLVIYRDMDALQQYDAEVGDGFNTDTFERQLDRMVMVIQQTVRDVGLTVQLPITAVGGTGLTYADFIAARDRAETAADEAEADAVLTAADRFAVAADLVQTDLDTVATGADRVQTGLDRIQTGLDRAGTAEDLVQTDLDMVATAADRVQTGLDRIAVAADLVQTDLDTLATAADRIAVAADLVQTDLDMIATAADRVQTGQDVITTAASRDKAQQWAIEAVDVPVETGEFSAKHWATKALDVVSDGGVVDPDPNSLAKRTATGALKVANAAATNEAVALEQLNDAITSINNTINSMQKVYSGTGASPPNLLGAPAGWTLEFVSTGIYRIHHNLGKTLNVSASMMSALTHRREARVRSSSINNFELAFYDQYDALFSTTAWSFVAQERP